MQVSRGTPPDSVRMGALVREHYARLVKFASRYVAGRDEAEDIVQDVFVQIWEHAHHLDFDDPLPYLYRATRNAAMSMLRRRTLHERWRDRVAREEPRVARSANARIEGDELRTAVAAAVEALPGRCREVFLMHREQNLSYPEIARVLGLSVKTVDNHMGRALKLLRTRLAPWIEVSIMVVVGSMWLQS